jgi:hypothetical protein
MGNTGALIHALDCGRGTRTRHRARSLVLRFHIDLGPQHAGATAIEAHLDLWNTFGVSITFEFHIRSC